MCSIFPVRNERSPFGVSCVSVVNTSVHNARSGRIRSGRPRFLMLMRSRLDKLEMLLFTAFCSIWVHSKQTATFISISCVTQLSEALLQFLVDLVLSSRPDVVLKSGECAGNPDVSCVAVGGQPVRRISATMSCGHANHSEVTQCGFQTPRV